MSCLNRRSLLAAAAIPAAIPVALASPALSSGLIKWRMTTSWPRDLTGPGASARQLAERIGALSGGRLTVDLFSAGEIAPAFGVFDAVSSNAVEIGHTAAVFDTGKAPAAAVFTSAPFGLTPVEHLSWLDVGGGREIWAALYEPYGVLPFAASNTGASMGGWFRREIASANDLAGIRMRIAGLGAQVMAALGVTAVGVAPGEIFTALQTGAVDAAEFASPGSDLALGLYKAASYYYGPGFHEPNGVGEALVNRTAWEALSVDLRIVVETACAAEHAAALAEAERQSAEALAALVDTHGVKLRIWPAEVMSKARAAAVEVMGAFAAGVPIERKMHESYMAALGRSRRWAAASAAPFLTARG